MRERLRQIIIVELGPRTDLGIEAKSRVDMEAERLLSVHGRLLRDMTAERIVGPSRGEQQLRAGSGRCPAHLSESIRWLNV